MIFNIENISFFSELNKTNCVIRKDNEEYHLYEAPTWEIAQKVDALMGNTDLGYDIDEYLVNKDINI